MNLRTQMLLAGALTLAVPVIGWQSVKQLDESLRQTRVDAQSLKVANARLALAESDALRDVLLVNRTEAGPEDLYAENANFPMFLDGYQDEWQNLSSPSILIGSTNADDAGASVSHAEMRLRLATSDNRLFVFINIRDDDVIYHKPPTLLIDPAEGEVVDRLAQLVNGDAVHLLVADTNNNLKHAVFRSEAPGPVSAISGSADANGRKAGRRIPRFNAFWAATGSGFQLEISLPMPAASSIIGIAYVDMSADQPQASRRWIGNMDPANMERWHSGQTTGVNSDEGRVSEDVGKLFLASNVAHERLKPWVTRGTRARLFDRQGRLLSDINLLYEKTEAEFEYDPAERGFLNAVLFRIFAYFVADPETAEQPYTLHQGLHIPQDKVDGLADQPASTQHYMTDERDSVLGTLVPIGGDEISGFFLFESNEDIASAYSASRVARLFSLLTLVSLLAGLVLLIYASSLSMRIRNLSKQATRAVAEDGRVQGLPQSDAKDEIGDLSRNLSALLDRSANYTKYLEALSSRLSHELRTPLSVVKTSIENMDRKKLDDETISLMDRASGGADQLGAIIRALVESTRLEQTVQQAQMQEIELLLWFQGALQRYSQVYTNKQFSLRVPQVAAGANINVYGSAELLQQAFDKLVDNAVAFSTSDNIVLILEVVVEKSQPWARMMVANDGPFISEDRQAQLFDPMFSDRVSEPDSDQGSNRNSKQRNELSGSGNTGELHLGLGLYIVRMVAEAHSGRTLVRNTPAGVEIGICIPLR